jgi:hypothetical protein
MKQQPGIPAILVCVLALVFAGCSSSDEKQGSGADSGQLQPAAAHGSAANANSTPKAGALKFTPQAGWIAETPTSSMRQAQFRLPKAGGDSDDAELVVFYFGGGGGGVQANIDRWIGQFSKPDGSPVTDARTSHRTTQGIPLTVVDVTGTYVGGMGSSESKPKTDFRMLAVVAEAGNGPWFFKLTGPAKTVTHWEPSFQSFLDSIQ